MARTVRHVEGEHFAHFWDLLGILLPVAVPPLRMEVVCTLKYLDGGQFIHLGYF